VNRILPIPARLSYEESILEPLKCAITVARGAAYEVGDRLALVGCGYMGLLTAACLRGPALRELIAIDLEPKRLELALRFGATAIIDAREGPAAVEDRVRDLTNGELIDIAIEATGNSSGLELAGKVLRRGRPKLLMMGFHARPQPLDLSGFSAKGVILHTTVPAYSLDEQSDLRRAVWALESGLVETRSLVTHRFPLRDIGHAFEAALSPSPDYIKGVVVSS
jgi:threonine dehydrogenase-like Zn-dependent dehydrogenase